MTKLSSLRAAQPHAFHTLSQALSGGRRHHAYLLAGPPETDPLALGEAFAASLLCTNRQASDACGECQSCVDRDAGRNPDFHRLTSGDKVHIGIDAIRTLDTRLSLSASLAPVKVALIVDADRMRRESQNALLKTLEEPSGDTCFILTTTRVRTLLSTVRSRSQTLRLTPPERMGAWKALEKGGIDAELSRPLAALVGPHLDKALELVELGMAEVMTTLADALGPQADHGTLLAAAAELGSDRDKTDLALALLEVQVRDRMAHAFGANDDKLYLGPGPDVPSATLDATAAHLQRLRRLKALNVNRTMALETVLLAMSGRAETHGAIR